MKNTRLSIYCNCSYADIISEDMRSSVLKKITSTSDNSLMVLPDLCQLAARKDPLLQKISDAADGIRIAACYPRAVKWLLEAAGVELNDKQVEYLNMRQATTAETIDFLCNKDKNHKGISPPLDTDTGEKLRQIDKDNDWIPWFPVIDYDRCLNCKQCLNFCLFGTYGLSADGRVVVQNPEKCKTNCPACARLCPQTAIIFPKYSDAPINGDEVNDDSRQQSAPVDVSQELGDDVYAALKQRNRNSQPRFAVDKKDDEAEGDRLTRLQKQLGIPAEVLADLSPEEIPALHNINNDGSISGSCQCRKKTDTASDCGKCQTSQSIKDQSNVCEGNGGGENCCCE